nr:C40 family peptidase [Candidatus Cloacimonadota bacterium]
FKIKMKRVDMFQKQASLNLIPGTEPEMNSPYFWLSRLDHIDETILTDEDIRQLNDSSLLRKLINNVNEPLRQLSSLHRLIDQCKESVQEYQEMFMKKELHLLNGKRLTVERIMPYFNYVVWYKKPVFAMLCHHSDERLLPIADVWMEKPDDFEFDFLQNNALDFGTLCWICAETPDNRWVLQINQSTCGWILKENIAVLENDAHVIQEKQLTVISAYAPLFADSDCTRFTGTVRMGASLYFRDESASAYGIFDPSNSTGISYILKKDVCHGYLTCTLRNIFEQAFKFLHLPYGWGDSHQFIDCSKFLQLTFATFGIFLPRNGITQGKAGHTLYHSETPLTETESMETWLIRKTLPGISFLRFPGHIMLYIGHYKEKAYVLHCLYKYLEQEGDDTIIRVVNRMVVTDLYPGETSNAGSFLKRLSQVNCLKMTKDM